MMKRIAIFASGSGSNAENIISYFSENKGITIPVILSNRQDAYVHERAKKLGVPSFSYNKSLFETGEIMDVLREYQIDFIVLAGFLLKISQPLLNAYPNKIINIHPALLPKYGGKGMYGNRIHEAVVAAGEKESGITIHYVNECYDEGEIIFQASCEVTPEDSPEDVAEKVHALEYEYFPKVIEQVIKADQHDSEG